MELAPVRVILTLPSPLPSQLPISGQTPNLLLKDPKHALSQTLTFLKELALLAAR